MKQIEDLDLAASDRLMDLGLRALADEGRVAFWFDRWRARLGVAVALLAVAVTVGIGTFWHRTQPEFAQHPAVATSWGPMLSKASSVSTRTDVELLPPDTTAVRLVRPSLGAISALAHLRSLVAVAIGGEPDEVAVLTVAEAEGLLKFTRPLAIELHDLGSGSELARTTLLRSPALKELRLLRNDPPANWERLPIRNLKRLAIECSVLCDADVARIALAAPHLEALELVGRSQIGARGLRELARMRQLRSLALRRFGELHSDLIGAVAAFGELTELDLSGSVCTAPDQFDPLVGHPGMSSLVLADVVGIGMSHLNTVVTMNNLVTIDLRSYSGRPLAAGIAPGGVSSINEAVELLGKMPRLRRVRLRAVHGLRLDTLMKAATGRWHHLDLRDSELMPPIGAPAGAGPIKFAHPTSLQAVLKVREVLL